MRGIKSLRDFIVPVLPARWNCFVAPKGKALRAFLDTCARRLLPTCSRMLLPTCARRLLPTCARRLLPTFDRQHDTAPSMRGIKSLRDFIVRGFRH